VSRWQLAVLIFRSVLSDALDLWNGAGPLGLVVFLAVPMIVFLAWAPQSVGTESPNGMEGPYAPRESA